MSKCRIIFAMFITLFLICMSFGLVFAGECDSANPPASCSAPKLTPQEILANKITSGAPLEASEVNSNLAAIISAGNVDKYFDKIEPSHYGELPVDSLNKNMDKVTPANYKNLPWGQAGKDGLDITKIPSEHVDKLPKEALTAGTNLDKMSEAKLFSKLDYVELSKALYTKTGYAGGLDLSKLSVDSGFNSQTGLLSNGKGSIQLRLLNAETIVTSLAEGGFTVTKNTKDTFALTQTLTIAKGTLTQNSASGDFTVAIPSTSSAAKDGKISIVVRSTNSQTPADTSIDAAGNIQTTAGSQIEVNGKKVQALGSVSIGSYLDGGITVSGKSTLTNGDVVVNLYEDKSKLIYKDSTHMSGSAVEAILPKNAYVKGAFDMNGDNTVLKGGAYVDLASGLGAKGTDILVHANQFSPSSKYAPVVVTNPDLETKTGRQDKVQNPITTDAARQIAERMAVDKAHSGEVWFNTVGKNSYVSARGDVTLENFDTLYPQHIIAKNTLSYVSSKDSTNSIDIKLSQDLGKSFEFSAIGTGSLVKKSEETQLIAGLTELNYKGLTTQTVASYANDGGATNKMSVSCLSCKVDGPIATISQDVIRSVNGINVQVPLSYIVSNTVTANGVSATVKLDDTAIALQGRYNTNSFTSYMPQSLVVTAQGSKAEQSQVLQAAANGIAVYSVTADSKLKAGKPDLFVGFSKPQSTLGVAKQSVIVSSSESGQALLKFMEKSSLVVSTTKNMNYDQSTSAKIMKESSEFAALKTALGDAAATRILTKDLVKSFVKLGDYASANAVAKDPAVYTYLDPREISLMQTELRIQESFANGDVDGQNSALTALSKLAQNNDEYGVQAKAGLTAVELAIMQQITQNAQKSSEAIAKIATDSKGGQGGGSETGAISGALLSTNVVRNGFYAMDYWLTGGIIIEGQSSRLLEASAELQSAQSGLSLISKLRAEGKSYDDIKYMTQADFKNYLSQKSPGAKDAAYEAVSKNMAAGVSAAFNGLTGKDLNMLNSLSSGTVSTPSEIKFDFKEGLYTSDKIQSDEALFGNKAIDFVAIDLIGNLPTMVAASELVAFGAASGAVSSAAATVGVDALQLSKATTVIGNVLNPTAKYTHALADGVVTKVVGEKLASAFIGQSAKVGLDMAAQMGLNVLAGNAFGQEVADVLMVGQIAGSGFTQAGSKIINRGIAAEIGASQSTALLEANPGRSLSEIQSKLVAVSDSMTGEITPARAAEYLDMARDANVHLPGDLASVKVDLARARSVVYNELTETVLPIINQKTTSSSSQPSDSPSASPVASAVAESASPVTTIAAKLGVDATTLYDAGHSLTIAHAVQVEPLPASKARAKAVSEEVKLSDGRVLNAVDALVEDMRSDPVHQSAPRTELYAEITKNDELILRLEANSKKPVSERLTTSKIEQQVDADYTAGKLVDAEVAVEKRYGSNLLGNEIDKEIATGVLTVEQYRSLDSAVSEAKFNAANSLKVTELNGLKLQLSEIQNQFKLANDAAVFEPLAATAADLQKRIIALEDQIGKQNTNPVSNPANGNANANLGEVGTQGATASLSTELAGLKLQLSEIQTQFKLADDAAVFEPLASTAVDLQKRIMILESEIGVESSAALAGKSQIADAVQSASSTVVDVNPALIQQKAALQRELQQVQSKIDQLESSTLSRGKIDGVDSAKFSEDMLAQKMYGEPLKKSYVKTVGTLLKKYDGDGTAIELMLSKGKYLEDPANSFGADAFLRVNEQASVVINPDLIVKDSAGNNLQFKVHVTATPENFNQLVLKLSAALSDEKLAYKVGLGTSFINPAQAQFGKVFTIYTPTKDMLSRTLSRVQQLADEGFSGVKTNELPSKSNLVQAAAREVPGTNGLAYLEIDKAGYYESSGYPARAEYWESYTGDSYVADILSGASKIPEAAPLNPNGMIKAYADYLGPGSSETLLALESQKSAIRSQIESIESQISATSAPIAAESVTIAQSVYGSTDIPTVLTQDNVIIQKELGISAKTDAKGVVTFESLDVADSIVRNDRLMTEVNGKNVVWDFQADTILFDGAPLSSASVEVLIKDAEFRKSVSDVITKAQSDAQENILALRKSIVDLKATIDPPSLTLSKYDGEVLAKVFSRLDEKIPLNYEEQAAVSKLTSNPGGDVVFTATEVDILNRLVKSDSSIIALPGETPSLNQLYSASKVASSNEISGIGAELAKNGYMTKEFATREGFTSHGEAVARTEFENNFRASLKNDPAFKDLLYTKLGTDDANVFLTEIPENNPSYAYTKTRQSLILDQMWSDAKREVALVADDSTALLYVQEAEVLAQQKKLLALDAAQEKLTPQPESVPKAVEQITQVENVIDARNYFESLRAPAGIAASFALVHLAKGIFVPAQNTLATLENNKMSYVTVVPSVNLLTVVEKKSDGSVAVIAKTPITSSASGTSGDSGAGSSSGSGVAKTNAVIAAQETKKPAAGSDAAIKTATVLNAFAKSKPAYDSTVRSFLGSSYSSSGSGVIEAVVVDVAVTYQAAQPTTVLPIMRERAQSYFVNIGPGVSIDPKALQATMCASLSGCSLTKPIDVVSVDDNQVAVLGGVSG